MVVLFFWFSWLLSLRMHGSVLLSPQLDPEEASGSGTSSDAAAATAAAAAACVIQIPAMHAEDYTHAHKNNTAMGKLLSFFLDLNVSLLFFLGGGVILGGCLSLGPPCSQGR